MRLLLGLFLGCFALLASAPRLQASSTGPKPRTVLVLYSFPFDTPGIQDLTTALRKGIQDRWKGPLNMYFEYTGLDRHGSGDYARKLKALYDERYGNGPVDAVIAVGPAALDWVVTTRFQPEAPVVTCYVAGRFVGAAKAVRPELTGAIPAQGAPGTIELMLRMFPATRRVHVVLGSSDYERGQAQQARRLFAPYKERVEFIYLNDLSLSQLLDHVHDLGGEDLVLFGSFLVDAAGQQFTTNEVLRRISRACRRPLFGAAAEDLGFGILGGDLVSQELSGRAASDLALRILQGESAAAIAPVVDAGLAPMFDERELRRWRIRARDLPPGSIVRFHVPGIWELYWKPLCVILGIILVESFLVAGLLINLRHRRRATRELRAAHARYRTVAEHTQAWEYWQREDGTFEYLSPSCVEVSGYSAEAFERDASLFAALVVEEDRPRWVAHQKAVRKGEGGGTCEFRIRTRDGAIRWVDQTSVRVFLEDRASGTRGSIRDISDRKKGEIDLKEAYERIKTLISQLELENTYYREKIQAFEPSGEILGTSDAMKYLHYRIHQVAASEATALIQGETGTGKELVAEAIHRLGNRADRALVKVNCAALPQSLAESELFGHEKGAFTGAQTQRKGRFELANGATLFLDEVGELSLEIQAKLLRVLQDGTFQRVGGDRTLTADVRILAATNRDLAKEVAAGRFRGDLWYRLNVFPITLPSLRERIEDIPILAQAFLERICREVGRPVLDLPQSVVKTLQGHGWPGNVRELQNVIHRAVLTSEGTALRLSDTLASAASASEPSALKTLVEMECDHIQRVMEATQGRVEGKGGAADILGMNASTLRSRMRKFGIERK